MTQTPLPSTQTAEPDAFQRLAYLAMLAVALGFAIQILLIFVKLAAQGGSPGMETLANIAGGVAWSGLVCTGIGVGVSLFKANALKCALVAGMFAPLAVAFAKGVHQLVGQMVGAAGEPATLSLTALGGIKAVEYALLGYLLTILAARGAARLPPYLGVGLGAGVVFGGLVTFLNATAGAAVAQLAATAVNEVLFPVGCAGVVYVGQVVSKR